MKLVLCDFDLSTFTGPDKSHTAVLGTDGFLAPEVLINDTDMYSKRREPVPYTKAVDIFSAGVVFGSLLYGVRETDMNVKVVQAWRRRLKRRTGKDSSPAQTLLRTMIMYDPSRRPTAEECLEHDFFVEKS